MNTKETDAMRLLDARLARLHADLDTRPGFEARLEAHIAMLAEQHAAATQEANRQRVEQAYAVERAAAGRDARFDAVILAIAGLAAALAAWRFGPALLAGLEPLLSRTDPGVVGLAALPVAAGALWVVLRLFGVDPRQFARP
jgi:hypothetical protein